MNNPAKSCQRCANLRQPDAKLVVEGPAALSSSLTDVSGKLGLAERRQVFRCRDCGQYWLATYDRHLEQHNFSHVPRHLVDELKTTPPTKLIRHIGLDKTPAGDLYYKVLHERFREIQPVDISACWKALLNGVVKHADDPAAFSRLMGLLSLLLISLQNHLSKSAGNVSLHTNKNPPLRIPDHGEFNRLFRRLSSSTGAARRNIQFMKQYKTSLTALKRRFPDGGEFEFYPAAPQTKDAETVADTSAPRTSLARPPASIAALVIVEIGMLVAAIFLVESGGSLFTLIWAGTVGLAWGWAGEPLSAGKAKNLIPFIWLTIFLPFIFAHYLNYEPTIFFDKASYVGRTGFTVTPEELVRRVNKAYDKDLTSPFWASMVNRAEVGHIYRQSIRYGLPRSHRKGWAMWFGWATQLFVSPLFGVAVFLVWKRTQKKS